MTRLPLVLGLAAVALLATRPEPGADRGPREAAHLAGTSWILARVAIGASLRDANDGTASLHLLADGSMAGSTGCNRFAGTWSSAGSGLRLTPGPMTLMACPDPAQRQESAVLAALAATRSYSLDDTGLVLHGDGGAVLAVYRPTPDLAGTAWRAQAVNNGRQGVVSEPGTGDLRLAFGTGATVDGHDGCAPFRAAYRAEGSAVAITGLPQPEPCGHGQQQDFLNALAAATRFAIDGVLLELRDSAGALEVLLVRAD